MKFILFSLLYPFILISFVSRLALSCFAIYGKQFSLDLPSLGKVFLLGSVNDLITYLYISSFVLLITSPLPSFLKKYNLYRYLAYLFHFMWIMILIFTCFAEFLFWDEFSSRFNFIAIDYLLYTREVIGNIVESYPIKLLLTIIFFTSLLIFIFYYKYLKKSINSRLTGREKIGQLSITLILVCLVHNFLNMNLLDIKNDRYQDELSKNGIYQLASAYFNNILDYKKFYKHIANEEAFKIIKKELLQPNQNYTSEDPSSIERMVTYSKKPEKYNIILIVVESLSKEFIGINFMGNSITPNLDKIAKESIVMSNFYATGTRTVRGLEALTLSVPPTPGSSIVRRPGNNNLFSISSVLKPYGYDMTFLYGGYGYFDNMNAFFSGNGFKIVDRLNMTKDEIDFENAWGVADENLFTKAIKEADLSFSNQKPFFQFIMTTSNHRPFTFPENRIDLPSGKGRYETVKYTDYAIGKLLKDASTKEWFDNTIFIITADHCASSAGKTQIPINKYHIPLYIYAPKIVKPFQIDKISSQIDLPPTILGLLNISYKSRFFGNDIFSKNNDTILLGTYQLLGFHSNNQLAILGPKFTSELYSTNDLTQTSKIESDNVLLNRAISYYQIASYLFQNNLMKE